MQKISSRKFLISVAAFLASLGTSIAGFWASNEMLATVGIACTVLSGAIYAACEAYVDGQREGANTTTKTIAATSTDRTTVAKILDATELAVPTQPTAPTE